MKNKPITYQKILKKKNYLPFYLYDYDLIERQILKLKNNLPDNFSLFYSAKANPSLTILKIIEKFGLKLEVVSLGELIVGQEAGFKSNKILFAGSTKSDKEILLSVKRNIGLFSIESVSELIRLNKIAKRENKKINVIVRLNLINLRTISDKDKKVVNFGLELEEFKKTLSNFPNNFPNINLKGVHYYGLSRVVNCNILIKEIIKLFKVVNDLEKKFNFDFEVINIGGGFDANGEDELNSDIFFRKVKQVINDYSFNDKKFILELGRYLVNESGMYISEIIDVDKKNNFIFLTIEGILSHLLKTSVTQEKGSDCFRVKILPEKRGKLLPTVIRGQMATTIDAFGRGFHSSFLLPKASQGNLIVIKDVGAYGLTQAVSLFGSRPLAAEFMLINNKIELIREKGGNKDFLLRQKIPFIFK